MTSSGPTRASSLLTREEIVELTRASDLRGALAVATSWGMIAGAFALAAWSPLYGTVPAMVLLGGRHLALAILMHEAAHRSLFRTRWLNDGVGRFLCAAPVWQDLTRYRVHHLKHHNHANTALDPDLSLIEGVPMSKRSFARKMLRDLSGWTGLRRVVGLVMMDAGFIEYTAANDARRIDQSGRPRGAWVASLVSNTSDLVLTNLVLFHVLRAVGHPWLYGLWVLSWLTTFSAIVRIRSLAEHAGMQRSDDPMLNTRTTLASPLARVTVAPHRVNYHLEHHLLMQVPYFQLPRMHALLRERGALARATVARNYREVLSQVIR